MDEEWSSEFPTETGWWWFYGYLWGKGESDTPRLEMMEIIQDGEGNLLSEMENSFIFRNENQCEGVFQKATPPPIPLYRIQAKGG